jgi:hypothetical protein
MRYEETAPQLRLVESKVLRQQTNTQTHDYFGRPWTKMRVLCEERRGHSLAKNVKWLEVRALDMLRRCSHMFPTQSYSMPAQD